MRNNMVTSKEEQQTRFFLEKKKNELDEIKKEKNELTIEPNLYLGKIFLGSCFGHNTYVGESVIIQQRREISNGARRLSDKMSL